MRPPLHGKQPSYFGQWLREERLSLGLTQTELAERANISSVQITCRIIEGARAGHLCGYYAAAGSVVDGCR